MIPEDRAEKALLYIRDNTERGGQLLGAKIESENRIKVSKAIEYLAATGTVDERKSKAEISPEVKRAVKDYVDSCHAYETFRLEIKAADLTIDIWRSQNASNRAKVL